MQFLTSLIGGSENTFLTAVLALGIVLVLIILGLWALKLFFRASNTLVRGRNKRLTVVDQLVIDSRRQLMIVRRDNVEHLILTGGAQDLVVESGIPVEKAAAPSLRRTAPSAEMPPLAERPGPSQPVSDALEAAQALSVTSDARGSLTRFRDLGRPASPPTSLRHTGLMRPVSRMEPAAVIPINPDNSDRHRVDSAKTAPQGDLSEQARVGGDTYPADGVKAEGS